MNWKKQHFQQIHFLDLNGEDVAKKVLALDSNFFGPYCSGRHLIFTKLSSHAVNPIMQWTKFATQFIYLISSSQIVAYDVLHRRLALNQDEILSGKWSRNRLS